VMRYYGHFEGDATTYKDPNEVANYKAAKDPLMLFRNRSPRPACSTASSSSDRPRVQGAHRLLRRDRASRRPCRSRPTCSPTSTPRPTREGPTMPKKSYRQGDQRGAAAGDGARPPRHPHGRGHRGGPGHARASRTPGAGRSASPRACWRRFGRERVLDTPITESAFIGAAPGARRQACARWPS
jgi:hypothetical protein